MGTSGQLERELRYRSLHDPLTQLANRTLAYQRIDEALDSSRADGSLTAVVIEALARMRRQWPSAQLQLFLDDHPPPGASASAIDPLALIVPCPPPPPTQQLIQAFDNIEQQIRALPRPDR